MVDQKDVREVYTDCRKLKNELENVIDNVRDLYIEVVKDEIDRNGATNSFNTANTANT